MKQGKYEQVIGRIRKPNNSFVVTIPPKVMEYGGYKEGQLVKIWIKKEEE